MIILWVNIRVRSLPPCNSVFGAETGHPQVLELSLVCSQTEEPSHNVFSKCLSQDRSETILRLLVIFVFCLCLWLKNVLWIHVLLLNTAGGCQRLLTHHCRCEVRNSIYQYRKSHIDYQSKFAYWFISSISIIYGNISIFIFRGWCGFSSRRIFFSTMININIKTCIYCCLKYFF